MTFPLKIKEEALVSCQRRCCICHKFCGTKIECHHIRQPRDGGDDSIDNCIPLCLDCHAEVKAYNPLHPKGCAYTESELHRHRDNWFGVCSQNPLENRDAVQADIEAHSTNVLIRVPRLEARNLLINFADFCIKYQTLHPTLSPDRTQALTSEITRLKDGIEMLGPLSIPSFVDIYSSMVTNAWNMQRLLDRQMGFEPKPIESHFETVDDNIDGIIDWFSQAKIDIKEIIDPYLTF